MQLTLLLQCVNGVIAFLSSPKSIFFVFCLFSCLLFFFSPTCPLQQPTLRLGWFFSLSRWYSSIYLSYPVPAGDNML